MDEKTFATLFGSRLRVARHAVRQTLQESADEIGCRLDGLSRTELGKAKGLSMPMAEGISRWAVKHGISLDWLLTGTEPSDAEPRNIPRDEATDPDWLFAASVDELLNKLGYLSFRLSNVQQQLKLIHEPEQRKNLLCAIHRDWQPSNKAGGAKRVPGGDADRAFLDDLVQQLADKREKRGKGR